MAAKFAVLAVLFISCRAAVITTAYSLSTAASSPSTTEYAMNCKLLLQLYLITKPALVFADDEDIRLREKLT